MYKKSLIIYVKLVKKVIFYVNLTCQTLRVMIDFSYIKNMLLAENRAKVTKNSHVKVQEGIAVTLGFFIARKTFEKSVNSGDGS